MRDLLKTIKEKKVLLSDGAWGTMMFEKGLKINECPELWNLTNKKKVFEIAKSYVDAGADIIGTNSFGASVIKLKLYGLENKVEIINRKAASISREAAGSNLFVFGTVGPTGKILLTGDVSEKQIYGNFQEQCICLSKENIDAIIIETMTALDEALLAVRAAKENTKLPVICTFSFDKISKNEYRTLMGVSPTEMAKNLADAGVDIMGTNCGNGLEGMIGICKEIRKSFPDFPLIVQANAGLPQLISGGNAFPESPKDMADKIPQLIDLGVNIIGGCCGTNPKYIVEFSKVIHGENM